MIFVPKNLKLILQNIVNNHKSQGYPENYIFLNVQLYKAHKSKENAN
jgi:hypothetical protein